MIISDTQRDLLATDRWAWLGDVVDRWYADPLVAADGSSPEDIAAATQRIGGNLPTGVAEWFSLVGRRLRAVQDTPETPDTVYRDDNGRGVVVWTESQGGWALVAQPDGTCVLDEYSSAPLSFPQTPLWQALHGMLLSDTFTGPWTGNRHGPLGRLAPEVRGGAVFDADPEIDAVWTAYPELPVPGHPCWGAPPRGDADIVLRRGDEASRLGLDWITASRAAFDQVAGMITLDPPGGPQKIVLAFEELSPTEQATLTDDMGFAVTDPFDAAVRDFGHLGMVDRSGTSVQFHISTSRPDETIAALWSVVPAELAGKVVIAIRPARISNFRVVHPADRHA